MTDFDAKYGREAMITATVAQLRRGKASILVRAYADAAARDARMCEQRERDRDWYWPGPTTA